MDNPDLRLPNWLLAQLVKLENACIAALEAVRYHTAARPLFLCPTSSEKQQTAWSSWIRLLLTRAPRSQAVKCSDSVILLTNAGAGWVEQSGKVFMPRVLQKLFDLDIRIISAQAEYGDIYPGEPNQWKRAAFVQKLEGRSINLVSVGDSMFERTAAQNAGRIKDDHIEHTKTVKFIENPSVEELCTELQVS